MISSREEYLDQQIADELANPEFYAQEREAAYFAYELDEQERLEMDLVEAQFESDELWSFERV